MHRLQKTSCLKLDIRTTCQHNHCENMFKEELDDKLETAEELFELFNDFGKLKNYKYAEPVIGSIINPEEFHLELPYKDIR